jgi:hypothetical protein
LMLRPREKIRFRIDDENGLPCIHEIQRPP